MAEQPAPEDQTEADQAGKERRESFWASFNRDDKKLFVVTFAGTVAANVVTVLVVAVAIILDRPANGVRQPSGEALINLGFLVLGVGGSVGLFAFGRIRRRKDATPRTDGATFWFLTGLAGVLAVVSLLGLLGLAAGVK